MWDFDLWGLWEVNFTMAANPFKNHLRCPFLWCPFISENAFRSGSRSFYFFPALSKYWNAKISHSAALTHLQHSVHPFLQWQVINSWHDLMLPGEWSKIFVLRANTRWIMKDWESQYYFVNRLYVLFAQPVLENWAREAEYDSAGEKRTLFFHDRKVFSFVVIDYLGITIEGAPFLNAEFECLA